MNATRRSANYPHGIKVDTCAHLDCDRPRRSMQLCSAHLRRLYRDQSIATPIGGHEAAPAYVCARPGCDQPEFLDTLCGRHWRRRLLDAREAA